jgi:hypothetical protein
MGKEYEAYAMSRGLLVVDEDVKHLKEELQRLNFRVITPDPPNLKDDVIAESIASHRILITNKSKDYRDLAVEFEIGIIATEGVDFKDAKAMAKLISMAVQTEKIFKLHKPFVYHLASKRLEVLQG